MSKALDFTNHRFGKMVAVKRTADKRNGSFIWLCKCDCGNERRVSSNTLSCSPPKSCGCDKKGPTKDITGKKFGRLTAITRLNLSANGDYNWKCICSCGNEHITTIGRLQFGDTKSCGCLNLERITLHGYTGSPTHKAYLKMLDRCFGECYEEYYSDVTVCGRWLIGEEMKSGFECFLEDMGEKPNNLTLNRIHGAKEYSKENCEWASHSIQNYDQKMKSTNTSGRTGVSWHKEKEKWRATITKNKKVIHLGYYDDIAEASKARQEAELKYYGFTKQ